MTVETLPRRGAGRNNSRDPVWVLGRIIAEQDVVRDERTFRYMLYVSTRTVDVDDIVYALEADGYVTLHANGLVKSTGKGIEWHAARQAKAGRQ